MTRTPPPYYLDDTVTLHLDDLALAVPCTPNAPSWKDTAQ